MQINGPSVLSMSSRLPRAQTEPFVAVKPAAGGQTPAQQGGPLQHQVDVATILQHWGSSNPLADLNSDGIVNAMDLAMASQGQNGGAGGVVQNWGSGGSSDHNGDGVVNGMDLAMALNAQSAPGGPSDPWQQLTGGDLNGDGASNAMDLAEALNGQSNPSNAWEKLTGGDQNGDGIMNAMDLAMMLNSPIPETVPPSGPWQQLTGGDQNGDGVVDAQDLAISLNGQMKFDQEPAQLVEQVVNAAFELRDGDKDGLIAQSELDRDKQLFRRLDLDGDGSINREELTKALMSELDRFRTEFPGAAPSAFAKRWLEAFASDRGAPNLAIAAKAQKYATQADPLAMLGKIAGNSSQIAQLGGIVSAHA